MIQNQDKTISEFVKERNEAKHLFTPGPVSLLVENITGLRPCFGRGDADYETVEQSVIGHLKALSGHDHVIPMQGSASLALELLAHNFLDGKVLVVSTGYYSDRLAQLSQIAMQGSGHIRQVDTVSWKELHETSGNYDWIFSCSTETSIGLKLDMAWLAEHAGRLGARLALDATASIGLETGHHMADVIAFSSCKGLFGLAGAAFVAFNEFPTNQVNSFYLDLANHVQKSMTGPYHAMSSLLHVLPVHADLREAVVTNKRVFCEKMRHSLVHDDAHQPLICTFVNTTVSARNERVVLYRSRAEIGGQVVSHFGEVYLGRNAKGAILDNLEIDN
jgi:aspartate aminotransferase-like enzyme